MPVIGFINPVSPEMFAGRLQGFHSGLKDAGYVEGENVAIVYRWAENQVDRLPELAADLVRQQVAVFGVAEGPVKLGLVANLARPGGNLTGIN